MSLNADPTTTSPSEWSYVSEGGATIVFSYNGTHPAFTRNVLRLRKASLAQLSAQPNPDKENVEEPDDPSIAFLTKVTSLLIPSIHLPRLESVPVSGPWLKELASLAEDSRPALRRAKDGIDISRKKAVLATDLVGGKGWAVEIKVGLFRFSPSFYYLILSPRLQPKWAFLSNPTYASDETRDIKSRYCRFCMHSNHKAS
jgi:inositol-pentakisphosphate 2-kinase